MILSHYEDCEFCPRSGHEKFIYSFVGSMRFPEPVHNTNCIERERERRIYTYKTYAKNILHHVKTHWPSFINFFHNGLSCCSNPSKIDNRVVYLLLKWTAIMLSPSKIDYHVFFYSSPKWNGAPYKIPINHMLITTGFKLPAQFG